MRIKARGFDCDGLCYMRLRITSSRILFAEWLVLDKRGTSWDLKCKHEEAINLKWCGCNSLTDPKLFRSSKLQAYLSDYCLCWIMSTLSQSQALQSPQREWCPQASPWVTFYGPTLADRHAQLFEFPCKLKSAHSYHYLRILCLKILQSSDYLFSTFVKSLISL